MNRLPNAYAIRIVFPCSLSLSLLIAAPVPPSGGSAQSVEVHKKHAARLASLGSTLDMLIGSDVAALNLLLDKKGIAHIISVR